MSTTTYGWSTSAVSFQMNDKVTSGNQIQPAITSNAAGDEYFGVWTTNNGLGARLVDSDGAPLGSEHAGESTTVGSQSDPSVAGLKNGNFIETFTQSAGGHTSIEGHLFSADGSSPVAFDLPIIADSGYDAREADVTALADGGFAVTWTEDHGGGNTEIITQTFDANADYRTGTKAVIADGHANSHAATAGLAGGDYVVAWQEAPATGGNAEVRFGIFSRDGDAQVSNVLVDNFGNNTNLQVAALKGGDGGFVLAYTDTGWASGTTGTDITMVIYNSDGSLRVPFIEVNTGHTAGNQALPSLAVLDNGDIAVGWRDTTTNVEYVTVYDAQGHLIAPSTFVDTNVVEDQLVALSGGRVAIVGESTLPDGSGTSVHSEVLQFGRTITGDASDETFQATDDGIAERFVGMGGVDAVDYSHLPGGSSVHASLADQASNAGAAAGDSYLGISNLEGTGGNDVLEGDAGNNVLTGNYGNDTLIGGAGDDRLDGNFDNDTMIGGAGNDHYSVQEAGDVVIEQPGEGTDTVDVYLVKDYTLPANVENLVLFSGGNGTGNDLDNVITGDLNKNVLSGGAGNDTLIGKGGDDTLDGGAGDDTAVYGGARADYQITAVSGGGFHIVDARAGSPDGADTVTGVETFQFADGAISEKDLIGSTQSGPTQTPPAPTVSFDAAGYRAVYKDAAASSLSAQDHYHQIGWHEGHDPSANFDTTLYLIHNPDVAAAGVDPFEHYLTQGAAEGRAVYQAVGQTIVSGFDAEYYLWHNPDVAAAGVDPLAHFLNFGWHEGRNPNALFDTNGYLAHYADVAAAGVNPLQHYEQTGWMEGRDPSAGFDTLGYLAANPDVAAAHVNPLDHFLTAGVYEGRAAINDGLFH